VLLVAVLVATNSVLREDVLPYSPPNGKVPGNDAKAEPPDVSTFPKGELVPDLDAVRRAQTGGRPIWKGKDGDVFYMGYPEPFDSADWPVVELCFYRRKADASRGLEPFRVFQIVVNRFEKDQIVLSDDNEMHGGISLTGVRNWEDALSFRAMAAPVGTEDRRVWRLGRSYYVKFDAYGPDRTVKTQQSFETIVNIPDAIPRGSMWRIPVIADIRYPTLQNRYMEKPPVVEGRVRGMPPVPIGRVPAVRYRDMEPDSRGYVQQLCGLKSDGSFSVPAQKLGGDLRIADETGDVGWIYVRSVDKRKLVLPEDAVLVMRPEDLVSVRLPVPGDAVTPEYAGVMLKAAPESVLGMSWAVTRGDRARQELLAKGEQELRIAPGAWYYVAVYYDKVDWGDGQRERLLGKVTVGRESAGRLLSPQPLSEDETAKFLAAQRARPTKPLGAVPDADQDPVTASAPAPVTVPVVPAPVAYEPVPEFFERITGKIEGPFPAEVPVFAFYGSVANNRVRVNADGSFAFKFDPPRRAGDKLRITRGEGGWACWMVVRSLTRPEVSLPAQADVVYDPKSMVSVRIKMPDGVDPGNLLTVFLLNECEFAYPRPILCVRMDKSEGRRELLAETGMVEMAFVPGTYYCTGLERSFDAELTVWGKIVIADDSAGRTLEIQPLTEEESKQGFRRSPRRMRQ
jgi:hypothetical protein